MSLHHGCHCQFVPSQILERLARFGIEEARLSIGLSEIQRARRALKWIDQGILASFTSSHSGGKRIVYDAKHTPKLQRGKPARSEPEGPVPDEDVNRVYDFAGTAIEYFSKQLSRDSIDGLGMNVILNVNFRRNYANAFWDGDELAFGDGIPDIFESFTSSLEVVAHEFAHGVTQYTANLRYYSQSGALNEHFSDVFGSAITQAAEGTDAASADWLIGDEIMGERLYGEAFRSMREPGTAYDNEIMGKDPQPSHMDDYYTGAADNQGVHINSGIPNKAFYVASRELDTQNAAKIWYGGLQKLWPTAGFNDAVEKLVESARLLAASDAVRSDAAQVVRAAFKEVGLPV